jgi:hypothetical protein
LVIGIDLDGIDVLASCVGETASVNHLRTADMVVSLAAVGLKQPVKTAQGLLSALASAAHFEVEHHAFSRRGLL